MEKFLELISKILLAKCLIILPNVGMSQNLLVRYIEYMCQTDVE
jgi:hypothetical protein